MIEFQIKDFELGGKITNLKALGIAEAMLDYLPWPTLDISIYWQPIKNRCTVIDKKTDFKYEVKSL